MAIHLARLQSSKLNSIENVAAPTYFPYTYGARTRKLVSTSNWKKRSQADLDKDAERKLDDKCDARICKSDQNAYPLEFQHSLATRVQVLPDVHRTAIFDTNCCETQAAAKRFFVYLFERAGKRDLLNPAELEAITSNVLHPARNLNALEILAKPEHIVLNPL